jgi:hypothetical protein
MHSPCIIIETSSVIKILSEKANYPISVKIVITKVFSFSYFWALSEYLEIYKFIY